MIATALAKAPAASAALLIAGLSGKFLFNQGAQILITAKGVQMGIRMAGGTGMGASAFGGKGKGGGLKGALNTRTGKALGGVGVALTGASSIMNLTDKDKSNDAAGIGGLVGMGLGGLLGLIGGPGGALLGASLGGMAGQTIGGMFGGGKAFGGGMDAGKTYLTGERGPELVTAGTSSTVTANSDLKNTFNTEALEMKLNSTVSELNAANKTLTNMVNSVNTLVAVESRALKAVETTARKDRNQVGMV